jgi:hypothetical protein
VAIAVTLDDVLHDRRMTLTELAERIDLTPASLATSCGSSPTEPRTGGRSRAGEALAGSISYKALCRSH